MFGGGLNSLAARSIVATFAARAAAKQLGTDVALVRSTVGQLAANPSIAQVVVHPAGCSLTFGGPDSTQGHIDVLRADGVAVCSSRARGKDGKLAPVVAGGEDHHEGSHGASVDDSAHGHGIHMPSPSYWPVIAAAGLPVLFYGLVYNQLLLIGDGALILLAGLYGWAVEPSTEPEA